MIHERDREAIKAMLGLPEVPKELEQEYAVRRRLLELAMGKHSRPLGAIGLIDLIRSLGFDPAEEAKPDIPWERYPTDGSIRVEALWSRTPRERWLTGVLCGVSEQLVFVKLDGDLGDPCAFEPGFVRLAAKQCPSDERDTLSPCEATHIDIELLNSPSDDTDIYRPPVAEAALDDPAIKAVVPQEIAFLPIGSRARLHRDLDVTITAIIIRKRTVSYEVAWTTGGTHHTATVLDIELEPGTSKDQPVPEVR